LLNGTSIVHGKLSNGKWSLFFVSVVVVNTDQTTCEGEYLAEGDEYRVVDLSQRRATEPR
jgi:hypothetical protein